MTILVVGIIIMPILLMTIIMLLGNLIRITFQRAHIARCQVTKNNNNNNNDTIVLRRNQYIQLKPPSHHEIRNGPKRHGWRQGTIDKLHQEVE